MKSFVLEEKFTSVDLNLWHPIQKLVHDGVEFESPEVSEFFRWFKDYELKECNHHKYREIYYSLPFSLAKILNEVYKILDINIHDPAPPLPKVQKVKQTHGDDTSTLDSIVYQPEIKNT
jgi:hypothetical protein